MAGADQVVCPFFGVVYERLQSFIYKDQLNKHGPLVKLKEELRKLFKTFLKIKEVLDDAEEKQFNEKAVSVRFWLQELNDAAYEADDVFDEFEYEALQQLASEGASSSNSNVIEQLHGKIQKLIEIFQALAKECSELDLRKGKEKSVLISHDRITDPLLTEPKVYGRDEDREQLVKQLLGPAYLTLQKFRTPISYKHPTTNPKRVLLNSTNSSSSSEDNFSVFPIQGMGGLGKTTLAKMVYNDERVKSYFKFRSWVCISTDFDTKRIMKEVVASLPMQTSDADKLKLQKHFHEELRGKRFLVVLDDVWNVTQDGWNELKAFFRAGEQGSYIIVTTRLPTVASVTSALPLYRPKKLSINDCLALFKQYAFGPGNEETSALVKIGKKIVKKCQGLPLAAKALGGLLRFKNDETEWRSIKDSAIWEFPNDILPALRISYYHLSFPLKLCFVYCSIFPKDRKIGKKQLIELWMANGLVQPRAEMDLVDAANAIFNELLRRSFFQDIEKDEDGNISCKMHDLVHDLASSIAGDEYFVEDAGSARRLTERTRHASIQFEDGLTSMQISSRHLRSLIQSRVNLMTPEFISSDFILLRALDMSFCNIKVVPDCIGEMKHLRYLNLSCNPAITSLPESICLLRNMQTLNLGWCSNLASLPAQIEKMRCLINLVIEGCVGLTSMPVGIGQLHCLRTLSWFVVGKGSGISVDWFINLNNLRGDLSTVGKESGSGVDGLQNLNNLTGDLSIYGLDAVETLMEAKEANLKNKKNIHSLKLYWAWPSIWSRWISTSALPQQQRHHNVIEGLQPHSNIRKLEVRGYKGLTLSPSWLTEEASWLIPNLVKICLSDCTCEHLGSLRKLPCLKILEFWCMDSLKFIEEGEVVGDASAAGGFPSLEELKLVGMDNLEGWSSSSSSSQAAAATAVFPCLKKVVLKDCPKVEGVPLAWSPVKDVVIKGRKAGGYCNGMVLGSLRDLTSLLSLRIRYFNELEYFPSGTLTNLTALHKLEFSGCYNLKALPVELYSLATLTKLKILSCPNLVSLAAEERERGLKNLSSLKTLHIKHCKVLKCLPELEKASLVTLKIGDCPEMEFSREDFEHLVVLEELQLIDLPKLVSLAEDRQRGLKNLSSLKTLVIERCKALKRLPELAKASLVSLRIKNCPEMEFSKEDFEHLVVLEELKLIDLPKLVSLAEDRQRGLKNLSSLKTLSIWGCPALKRLPELRKASLVTLDIKDCPEMEFSKEDFEHLVVLEELQLVHLPKLTCFPEGIKHSAATLGHLQFLPSDEYGEPVDLPDWIGTTLTSLEHLVIAAHKNWNVLPQWMQYLTALKRLDIVRCNQELVKRWKSRDRQREVYNSFNMISHVPYVELLTVHDFTTGYLV